MALIGIATRCARAVGRVYRPLRYPKEASFGAYFISTAAERHTSFVCASGAGIRFLDLGLVLDFQTRPTQARHGRRGIRYCRTSGRGGCNA
jgi:hypothetical protein